MMLDAPLFLSILARFLLDHPIVVFAAFVTLRSESRQSLWMLARWQQMDRSNEEHTSE